MNSPGAMGKRVLPALPMHVFLPSASAFRLKRQDLPFEKTRVRVALARASSVQFLSPAPEEREA